jgi:hypothetical protein
MGGTGLARRGSRLRAHSNCGVLSAGRWTIVRRTWLGLFQMAADAAHWAYGAAWSRPTDLGSKVKDSKMIRLGTADRNEFSSEIEDLCPGMWLSGLGIAREENS